MLSLLTDKIFGNGERFAVIVRNVERLPHHTGVEYDFGNVNFSIEDKRLGDEMIAPFYPCYLFVKDFLAGQAVGASLDPCGDCETLFKEIRGAFFHLSDSRGENSTFDENDADAWKAAIQKEEQYRPLKLPTHGDEFFDGWLVFVVRNNEACRVIFTDTHTEDKQRRIVCTFLEWEEIASPLQEFCVWYEAYSADYRTASPPARKKKRK